MSAVLLPGARRPSSDGAERLPLSGSVVHDLHRPPGLPRATTL
ncbi:hypothetical protein ACFPM0_03220 [Pseudonocardia sulfidoxydans]